MLKTLTAAACGVLALAATAPAGAQTLDKIKLSNSPLNAGRCQVGLRCTFAGVMVLSEVNASWSGWAPQRMQRSPDEPSSAV
ncbi:MAG: hypothetical protein K0S56_2390 [Microvirga sp.]|nr:hypothetical protein [Microvirga sp.]